MRDYLSEKNLLNAAILAAFVTVLSAPRIILWGVPLRLYIPAAFVSMTLVCGAPTAWSSKAGMAGLFPGRGRMIAGVAIAAVAATLIAMPYLFWLDPVFITALKAKLDAGLILRQYPATTHARIALILWSASFETVFFQAGTMSLAARISGRQWLAVVVTVGLRLLVTSMQFDTYQLQIDEVKLWLYASEALACAISAGLFARTGLPASMVFAAVLSARMFFLSF